MNVPYALRHARRPLAAAEASPSGNYNGSSRNPAPIAAHLPDQFGCLLCCCWCGCEFLHVPVELVRRCETLSCDRPGCVKP